MPCQRDTTMTSKLSYYHSSFWIHQDRMTSWNHICIIFLSKMFIIKPLTSLFIGLFRKRLFFFFFKNESCEFLLIKIRSINFYPFLPTRYKCSYFISVKVIFDRQKNLWRHFGQQLNSFVKMLGKVVMTWQGVRWVRWIR